MSRPELYGPAEVVYNREAAAKYTEVRTRFQFRPVMSGLITFGDVCVHNDWEG